MLEWKKQSSSIEPLEYDDTSSSTTIYFRKNIKKVTETNEFHGETTSYQYDERIVSVDNFKNLDIEVLKRYCLIDISKVCEDAIYSGVDVETTNGVEHFSMSQNDQINISALLTKVISGEMQVVPYHADGELCRFFEKDEFIKVAQTVEYWKTYNTTLCNHINKWINRTTDKKELLLIGYDSPLPDDLQESFNKIMNIVNE